MQFVSTVQPLTFEVTYDSNALYVAMSVYDDSGVAPVLVSKQAMTNVVGNTYRAKFTPEYGKTYLVFKAVYTDFAMTILSGDYSQASESFVCAASKIQDGQIEVKKGVELPNLPFIMLGSVNQLPTAGLDVVCEISKDGGAFAASANPVSEIGLGFYKITLDEDEMDADTIGLRLSAAGANVTAATIITQE